MGARTLAERRPRRVDRYELIEEVGSGGMAVVYRGRDTALDREVAVKLLHPHLAARPESRARFSREARAVARLSHPNILEIFDYAGEAAVESFLVTEFVRGRTLRAFVDEVGVGHPEIGALVVRALADALVHAHAAGVIHRDLKPENVLVVERGRRAVKLVDFGIARILTSDDRMTMTGALVGSPNHMAPEIIEGREADPRSDLFSLGTILYWLATGELPFAAPNPTATLRRVLEGDQRDPREISPLVSDRLAEAIARSLAVDPAQRTPSAAALRDELDLVLSEAGLADPTAELDAFLADPQGYRAAFPARLVAALAAGGEAALAGGQTARALKLFNRVLAIDPDEPRVLAHLARLARRGRLRRTARVAAAGLALALGAGAAFAGWRVLAARRPQPPVARTAPPAGPVTAAPEAPAVAPAEPRSEPPAPAGSRPEPATPPPAPAAQPATRAATAASPASTSPSPGATPAAGSTVSVLVRPYAQRALLDGVEVASGAQQVVFTLAPGRAHRIQIEHPCCEPFVREFGRDEPLPPTVDLRVPLQPRPARLRVEAEPQARVLVDGRPIGTAGQSQRQPFAVAVPANGPTPYEGTAIIRIEAPGRPAHVTQARLRAGAELNVVAPLTLPPPEPPPDGDVALGADGEAGASTAEENP
jgi:serine/threonine-protein kinase